VFFNRYKILPNNCWNKLFEFCRATPEALNNANATKPMGGPLPGSTSAATDPNAVFQLQRDISTSISINQLQNTLAQVSEFIL
jgi:hypothetical protein